jgi:2-polyprenyl-6-methoxyphenol hydroxylase-like FAD-dependent oxidoreductase
VTSGSEIVQKPDDQGAVSMTIPSIAIVGAGASGTLLAVQLSRKVPADTRITLIERNAQFGVGLAYSTDNPNHLVNIPIGRMSAFEDRPNHFVDWMQHQSSHILTGVPATESAFVPRRVYGAYLRDLLSAMRPEPEKLHEEVVSIEVEEGMSRLRCASGRMLLAGLVVLATGNDHPATPEAPGLNEAPFWRSDSWRTDAFAGLDPSLPVLLIGTGPTAVDAVITLLDQGHVGLVYAVSRRGLLSRPHGPVEVVPIKLPLHAGLGELTRFVSRGQCQWRELAGRDRRGVPFPPGHLAVVVTRGAAAVPTSPPPVVGCASPAHARKSCCAPRRRMRKRSIAHSRGSRYAVRLERRVASPARRA